MRPAAPEITPAPAGDSGMDPFTVSHFSDRALLHDLKALVAQDRKTTAVLLTRIAEVEERKLYRQAGYDSMFACCLHELHFSEDAALPAHHGGARRPAVPGRARGAGRRPLAHESSADAGSPPDVRERRRAGGGGHAQDPGRDRAAARPALPAAGPAATPAGRPFAGRAGTGGDAVGPGAGRRTRSGAS